MEQKKNNLLTTNELICTIIAIIIGITILYLPNSAAQKAKQDGWISTLLGAVYPLYVLLISSVILKRYPNVSIMELYKQYLGKFLGNIFNFLYMIQFLYYAVGIFTAAINLFMVYSSWFMTSFKMTIIFAFLIVYAVSKGLKVLAKINVISLFIMCVMLLSGYASFERGSLLNLQPVFGSGFNSILSGILTTTFSYGTMSVILIINPYVEKKDKIIKSGLISTAICTLFYTWSVLTSIVCLGVKMVTKSLYPFAFVTENIRLTLVNNYRFIWMLLWPVVVFRTVAMFYYMSIEILNHIFKIGLKKWCVILLPVLIVFPMLFENEATRREFYGTMTTYVGIYDIVYITLIAILILFKGKQVSSKNC